MPETRLRTTRDEVDTFYAAAQQGYWNFDDFMLAGNPRFNEVDWNTFDDAGYLRLTRAQQVLNCVALFQQQLFQMGSPASLSSGRTWCTSAAPSMSSAGKS